MKTANLKNLSTEQLCAIEHASLTQEQRLSLASEILVRMRALLDSITKLNQNLK